MSAGGVTRLVARRLPGIPDDVRGELIESIDERVAELPRRERLSEIVSLGGYALAFCARRGTGDDRREMVRQGVYVGALVVAIAVAIISWADVGSGVGLAVAFAASAVAGLIAWGRRGPALLAAIALIALQLAAGGGATVIATLVVVVALAAGARFDDASCPVSAVAAASVPVLVGSAGSALGPIVVEASLAASALAAAAILLALGWFDPRLAVAAVVVCVWRFVVADLATVADSVQALATETEVRLFLLRWLAMGASVAVAWVVARSALDRCGSPSRLAR